MSNMTIILLIEEWHELKSLIFALVGELFFFIMLELKSVYFSWSRI